MKRKKSLYDKYENPMHDGDDLLIDSDKYSDKYENELHDGDDLLIDTPEKKEEKEEDYDRDY
jgi:hypothetical protein